MIKTSAIRNVNNDAFFVVWDTGRRCNYDCTYCEASRHDNHSKHKSLDELKETFDFVKQWSSMYNAKRKNPPATAISFTGGEPTVNPNFWKLVDYIKEQPEEYNLSLTTNGAWHPKFSKKIIDNFGGATVSYHAEAAQSLKDQAIENILLLAETDMWLQVNIMLHVDYWDETVAVYNMLKSKGIKCSPRPIGDGAILRKGWFIDSDGTNRRTSHEYTVEQQAWFWNEMGVKEKPAGAAEGNQLGRACCGGRKLEGKVDEVWQPIKLIETKFENWHCMVDWFFLYVDQETKDVYHHQTCKAFFDKTTGAIGNLSNAQQMLDDLKNRLNQDVIPSIVCPNIRCGCGMCTPKAKNIDDFKILQQSVCM